MLRLQRGEPVVFVAGKDARARNVADGDRIRVFSDVGEFEAMAKVAFSVRPGQVIIYHAWEPYQFKGWKGQQDPSPRRSSLCISPVTTVRSTTAASTTGRAIIRARSVWTSLASRVCSVTPHSARRPAHVA